MRWVPLGRSAFARRRRTEPWRGIERRNRSETEAGSRWLVLAALLRREYIPGMNALRMMRFWLAWLGGFAGGCLALVGLAADAGEATRYALVQGSTYTAGGRAPLVPLHGSFRLVPQISPLDRQFFAVTDVRFEIGSSDGPRPVWRGNGSYAMGGRGVPNQQLILDLTDGVAWLHFDSGLVPTDGNFPELDLKLVGDSLVPPAIHCLAVPELSRQHYRSVLGMTFLDDCAICDHLPHVVPVAGSFDLVRTGGTPLADRYHVFNLHFSDDSGIDVTGEGTLEVGGEVAIQHRWTLQLLVRTANDTRFVTLRNSDQRPGRLWPMLQTELAEDGGSPVSRVFLTVTVAPFREIWFGLPNTLTPSAPGFPTKQLGRADIVSDRGRVVVAGSTWQKATGLPASIGLDAFDVVPGGAGVIAISPDRAGTSTTLGGVGDGDVLGTDGRVRLRYADLLGSLGVMPPVPDLGVDALFQVSPGLFWYSTRQAAFSERLGVSVGRGDLVSSQGTVVRTHAALMARFHRPDLKHDYGLDAFYVWPSGEIWFSVEEAFPDAVLGYISDGDLLSDQGYIVARNLALVGPFQPRENAISFGLRGLWIVSDAGPSGAAPEMVPGDRSILNWKGTGRVYQVETTDQLGEPWAELSPLLPAVEWLPSEPVGASAARFYRIRSW